MANYTVSDLGQVNDSGSRTALFLKQFAGETLASFQERNLMLPLTTVRSISQGHQAQFPLIGTNSASYHTPGNEIDGGSIKHGERVIAIDDLMISSVFIAKIDEAMNHYDVRGEYSKQCGFALANALDKAILRSLYAGSQNTANVIGETAGGYVVGGATPTGDTIVDAIMDGAKKLDERDVPQTERFVILPPDNFYLLLKAANTSASAASALLSVDFGQGANMTQGGHQIIRCAGIPVYMSTHVPTGDESTVNTTEETFFAAANNNPFDDSDGSTDAEGYSGEDFTTVAGLVGHKSAVGTVKLMDVAVESDYQVQRQGTLMVAKMAVGSNYLRSEACINIKKADS